MANSDSHERDASPPRDGWGWTALLLSANRGMLLDLFVFVLQLAAMSALSHGFVLLIQKSSAGNQAATLALFAMGVAMFVLAPVGATLKRWHLHQRLATRSGGLDADPMGSCLFNPIFYFCLTAVIFAAINAFVLQTVYGKQEPPGGVFVGSIFGGIALMIAHTALVYRYFAPPKKAPRSAFLRSPASGLIGDACLFLNMVLFQLLWGLLGTVEAPRPAGIFDVVFRVLILLFLALLIYFPPRMFYLAEDIGRKRTWVTILLANSPVLARFLLGTAGGW